MSHVIKLYGYREEEINEFVDEQKGRDAGRWERKVQCQAVKIKGILITYGYAKEKLTFQGKKEGAEELANLFTGVTLRKREAWRVQQQEASGSSERKAKKNMTGRRLSMKNTNMKNMITQDTLTMRVTRRA